MISIAAIGFCATTLFNCNRETNSKAKVSKSQFSENDTSAKLLNPIIKIIPLTDAPSFSSDEVNQGLSEYIDLKNKYLEVLKTKDTAALKSLSAKYLHWVKGATIWSEKLKPDEIKKYSDYVFRLNKEWTHIAQEAIK